MLKDDVYTWMQYKNYSENTAEAYWNWIVKFIKHNNKKHPSDYPGIAWPQESFNDNDLHSRSGY